VKLLIFTSLKSHFVVVVLVYLISALIADCTSCRAGPACYVGWATAFCCSQPTAVRGN